MTRSNSFISEARSRFKALRSPSDQKPPTFEPAQSSDDIPRIPDSQVFDKSPLSAAQASEDVPSVSQAAVHLALLEVFSKLKAEVTEVTGEVYPLLASFFGASDSSAEARWKKIAQQRSISNEESKQIEKDAIWKGFVELSVPRFEAWWKAVGKDIDTPLSGSGDALREFPAESLPPIGTTCPSPLTG